ncbi:hypothetical protein BDZ91DRAFT_233328 [Kalaharituber pfeilii]|nr:hypothetical protein BDZ91DRAFT_233328 [Kalaharituber pfeilii]
MEGIRRHRDDSEGVGPSRRPQKRPRTNMSDYDHRDDSPAAGPSTASRPTRSVLSLPSSSNTNASTHTVVVPGSVLLPNRDIAGRRTIIDLTEDSPPRRPEPEIIDVDALPDRPTSYFYDDRPGHETFEEGYSMLFARRRYPRPAGFAPPARPVEPNPHQSYPRMYPGNFQRYHPDLASPILGHGARMAHHNIGPGPNRAAAAGLGAGLGGHLLHAISSGVTQFLSGAAGAGNRFQFYTHQSVDINFEAPRGLDYTLGPHGRAESPSMDDAARRREQEYKPPPPPRAGFTRSPKQGDVLVCAMCDHELGQNSEEDERLVTVWLGKCGHCYCGRCAASFRSTPRPKKGRADKSGICAIDGCKTNLKGKGLWEVFL